MISRLGTQSLLARHLRAGIGASLLISLLIGVAVFAAAAAPRALQALGTDELHYDLKRLPVSSLDIMGSGNVGFVSTSASFVDVLKSTDDQIGGLLDDVDAPLIDGLGHLSWLARTQAINGSLPHLPFTVPVVELAVDLHWQSRVRFVDGVAPGDWAGATEGVEAALQKPIPIALSRDAATQMKVAVGETIGYSPAPLIVSGIYEPLKPTARYWLQERDLAAAALVQDADSPAKLVASAYVSTGTAALLHEAFQSGTISLYIPVDPYAYRYSDAQQLSLQLRQLQSAPIELPDSGQLHFRSDIPESIKVTTERVSSMSSLIALSVSGLVGLLLAVFAMCVDAVVTRRRPSLALAAARGSSPVQLRGVMVAEGLVLAVPPSIVGYLVAVVVIPGSAGLEGLILPLAVALAVPTLFGILTNSGHLRESRGDLSLRSNSPVRWILEVATIGLAIASVVLLQRRGLANATTVGIDPLLVAAPLLIAAAVAVVVMRLYPLPLRAVEGLLKRRSDVAALVGAARAVRSPVVGFAAVLALVVGVTVVVFTLVMVTTVRAALENGARDEVGADVQITAHDLPDSLVTQLSAIKGVNAVVALTVESDLAFSDEAGPTDATVVLADTAALHKVRPDIPVLSSSHPGPLHILISDDMVDSIHGKAVEVVNSQSVISGVIASDALPGVGQGWILVDSGAATELGLGAKLPDELLLDLAPGFDNPETMARLSRAVVDAQGGPFKDSSTVLSSGELLREITAAPTVGRLDSALFLAVGASLALTLVTVVLASMGGAASRNKAVGLLRVLGMTPRQIRTLVAWELGPVCVVAALVGTGVGLALPYVVTSVLDLRGFLGGTRAPGPEFDWLWVVVAVAVFGVVVVAAGLLASALGRRFAPAGTLKMGEA